jgi:hypothetical protein
MRTGGQAATCGQDGLAERLPFPNSEGLRAGRIDRSTL